MIFDLQNVLFVEHFLERWTSSGYGSALDGRHQF